MIGDTSGELDELMAEQQKAWCRLSEARKAMYKSRRRNNADWIDVERELEAAEQEYKDVYNRIYAFEKPMPVAQLDGGSS